MRVACGVALTLAGFLTAGCHSTPPFLQGNAASVRGLRVLPGANTACPGQLIRARYVADLTDGSTRELTTRDLTFVVRSGTAAEANGDGTWATDPDPVISAVSGFRLRAAVRGTPASAAETTVVPDYGCLSRNIFVALPLRTCTTSIECSRLPHTPDVTVRVGIFRTPFHDSVVVATFEVFGRVIRPLMLDPRFQAPNSVVIRARGEAGAQGGTGTSGTAGQSECSTGGQGGPGQAGGDGGTGGTVTFVVQDSRIALLQLFDIQNSGGPGGPGGNGGPGGRGGASRTSTDSADAMGRIAQLG